MSFSSELHPELLKALVMLLEVTHIFNRVDGRFANQGGPTAPGPFYGRAFYAARDTWLALGLTADEWDHLGQGDCGDRSSILGFIDTLPLERASNDARQIDAWLEEALGYETTNAFDIEATATDGKFYLNVIRLDDQVQVLRAQWQVGGTFTLSDIGEISGHNAEFVVEAAHLMDHARCKALGGNPVEGWRRFTVGATVR